MTTNFANSVAWANAWAMTLLLMQPPSPPLAPGVYRIGGADYAVSWTGPVCVVEPQDGTRWTGEGRIVEGKLEIRWDHAGQPALGVYTVAADRRSAAGTWGWIGDGSQHAETLTMGSMP